MRLKKSQSKGERRHQRFTKKSFKEAILSRTSEEKVYQDSDAGAILNSSLMSSLVSRLGKIAEFLQKMDSTKILLGFLMTLAVVLMQYGTRQETNESIFHTSLKTTTYKASDSIQSYSAFNDQGHQAQSQVPIPIEFSHFVELSEFADAVEALRIHRNKMAESQNNRFKYLRGLQSDNVESDIYFGQDDEEEVEMQDAMDAAWDKTIQQADSSRIQQMQTSMPPVKHVPFFWHIPRAGGTTLSTLFGACLGLVQASSSYSSPAIYTRWGDQELANRFKDPKLYVVTMKQQQFVNVDLNDIQGVMRAVKGKLISNKLADVVVVQDVSMGSFLLEEDKNANAEPSGEIRREFKGVLFAMFRHPVDRAISSFYSKQQVHDVHFDPSLEIYSLTDWANSPQYINDYMVRSLIGKLNERSPQNQPALNRNDLDVAKEILRRKCLVGLFDEKTESVKRFEKFFGWSAEALHDSMIILNGKDTAERAQAEKWRKEIVKDEECKDRLLHYNWNKKHKHPLPEENETPYKLLESKNRYDIELFLYAQQLFLEQTAELGFDDGALAGH